MSQLLITIDLCDCFAFVLRNLYLHDSWHISFMLVNIVIGSVVVMRRFDEKKVTNSEGWSSCTSTVWNNVTDGNHLSVAEVKRHLNKPGSNRRHKIDKPIRCTLILSLIRSQKNNPVLVLEKKLGSSEIYLMGPYKRQP